MKKPSAAISAIPADMQAQLRRWADAYQVPAFVDADPVQVAHAFADPLEREVAALLAAIFAWGNRKTAIAKTLEVIERVGGQPAHFAVHHRPHDLEALDGFRHRTLNACTVKAIFEGLQPPLQQFGTLEPLFAVQAGEEHCGPALERAGRVLLSHDSPSAKLSRHVTLPSKGSTCKRMLLFLRWLVRPATDGIDLGLWQTHLAPRHLLLPLDVHSIRTARELGLLPPTALGWKAVLALTATARQLEPDDPARLDFALYGRSVTAKDRGAAGGDL